MDFKNVSFTCNVPKILWIEDFILELVKKLPAKLFGELRPWGSIITQYPFIHKFTIAKAMKAICKARDERTVLNEPLFPIDYRDSEDNLKQFIECKPIRIMIAGDTNLSFCELSHLLAEDFKTYTVTPEKLVSQEIDQGTQIGKWLQNILKTGKGVPTWVVMKLLEVELDKEKYVTKGFILTGFPIISSLITKFGENCIYKDDEAHDLKSEFIAREFIFPGGKEDEVLKNCVKWQLDFIYNLCCRPDYIIYLDTHHYTKQFAETIEIFQKFILFYFRENVIRIDCRIGTDAILNSIRNRFKYINFKVNYECFVMNESRRETMSLEDISETETVLPYYKWWISKFGQICPVNLHHGRLRLCDCKFPIRYLRNIFVCFSQEDRTQFIQNPGKYMNLVPKCRAAVIGPHRTGKTTLSQYLARLLQADIYRNHIKTSQEIVKSFDLTEEFEDLNEQLLLENASFKQNKIEEWTSCVLGVLSDIMSKVLNEGEKEPRFGLFTSINSDLFFPNMQTRNKPDDGTKQNVLDHVIFQKSFENITSAAFLSWLQSKSKSEPLYKQYVIDSAPLDINFWRDLLIEDELPDCVFFLKVSSFKKLIDTYSFKHNKSCVSEKYIYDKLCSKFINFKNILNTEVSYLSNNFYVNCVQIKNKSLLEKRYTNAMKFMEKYAEIQNFLQANNVTCIDVDISNQTWTQSILKALIEYMSMYQPKAMPMYNFLDNESEESYGSISPSLDVAFHEETTESNCSFETSNNNYGFCLDWCPVSLNNQNILKKGNSLYSAVYKNIIYTMHSKADLTEFILNPMLYSQIKFAVPPPRVFILGLNHRNKSYFAEKLASSLNVESVSYKQNITTLFTAIANENFSIQQLSQFYNKIKHQFLEDITSDYKKGVVLVGFPFLLEQFKDLITKNLYPECIFIFDDEEEIYQTFYRYFARLHMMQALTMSNTLMEPYESYSPDFRASSITSYIESLPENQKHNIEIKCLYILQLFQQEMLKIEEESIKFGISILKVPKNYKKTKEVYSFVECINNHRHRVALFENVKEITIYESEALLNSGYYRFSRFKYSCPVDVCRLMTLNQFEGLRKQGKVYPCIYLDFIYFVCGKKNLKDFKRNPLEFINTCNPPQLQDPIRIAVFGASKSGVSTICRTMAHEFGFKILSPKNLRDKTDSGLIDLIKMEKSSTPNGVILDNFPLTPRLLQEAAISTVDISIVFIIVSSFEKVLENWFIQNRNLKTSISISLTKIHKSFCQTLKAINCLRETNATSLLNIHYIDGDVNSWALWDKVKNETIKTTRCITSYKIKLIKNRCANLGYLNMFYDSVIFKREINHFYCQACLALGKLKAFKYFYVNVRSEFYTEKCQNLLNQPYGYTNDYIYKNFNFNKPFEANEMIEPLTTQTKNVMCMFQYLHIFYWACNDHTINFMLNTQKYFNDSEKLKPLYVPFLVMGYTREFVAFQGFCPVEYKHGKFVKGAMNLSVYYRKKVYLMSNIENTHEFLTFPEKYRNIKFDICFLSQNNAIFRGLSEDMISNVVHEVSKLRPRHFALDGRLSATTFLALKLKTLNSCVKYIDYWNAIMRNFTKDCKNLLEETKKYHQNLNRFVVRDNST